MEKIKIGSLGIFDEQKFKKLATDRENWLASGYNMLVNPNTYKVNTLAQENHPLRIIVQVKKILKENELYKTIVLTNCESASLPLFHAGQKIALTICIDDVYYTRPYSLSSSPSKAMDGEYHITIKDSDDIVEHYLFHKLKISEKFVISSPFGEFYFEPLRDERNVIGIVSDKGILPLYSMIQAILDGNENFNLTLFYSEKKGSDFLFKEELQEITDKTNKIKVHFVLSEEQEEGCLSGFVSTDKINPYYIEGKTTFFISGSEGLLKYLDKELEQFQLPQKYIRYDAFLPVCNIRRIVKYTLGIYINGEKFEIPCYNNKTIMRSIEEGGIFIPSKCHVGSCGFCRSELVKGEVKIVNDKRTNVDKKYNYIHPCCTYPLSDIEIIVR